MPVPCQCCSVSTKTTVSAKRQIAILGGDTHEDNPPLNILASNMKETELQKRMGPRIQRNVMLEAAVRMLTDHLIMYEAMDQVLNNRRLELLGENLEENTMHEETKDNIRNTDALSEYTVLGVDESLLKTLDLDTLNRTHNQLTKNYNAINSKKFSQYLNEVLTIPNAGPRVAPYRRERTMSRDGWKGSYVKIYQQERLTATAEMNKKLTLHIRDNFYAQGKRYSAFRERQPNFFAGVAEILMTSGALPDLKTFNILIRQFNLYRLSVPAKIVLDALLLSGLHMNNMVYTTALKMAISTNDKEGFMQLAKVFDFNSVTVADDNKSPLDEAFWDRFHPIKMSSYRNHDWPAQRPEDEELRGRFFSNPSSAAESKNTGRQGMHSVKVYTTLISGMVRFGWHWWIDVAIRKMAAEGFPLTLEVLTLNMDAARDTKDAAKAWWTWNEILKLPLPTPESTDQGEILGRDKNGFTYRMVPFDREAYLSCKEAAVAVSQPELLMQIEDYYRNYQLSQAVLQIELHQQLNAAKQPKRPVLPFFNLSKTSFAVPGENRSSPQTEESLKDQEEQQEQEKEQEQKAQEPPPARLPLPPSIKNITSFLFAGALPWTPKLATGTVEGGAQVPAAAAAAARASAPRGPAARKPPTQRRVRLEEPKRAWYEEF